MTNEEYDTLMNVLKILNKNDIRIPEIGKRISYWAENEYNADDKYRFMINRKVNKRDNNLIYLLFHKKSKLMIRLDMFGPAHDNLDGTTIETPHFHIYNEQYRHGKHAVSLKEVAGTQLGNDIRDSLVFFLEHTNVDTKNINIPIL